MEFTDEERAVLRAGLNEWGGPANPSDAIAITMGFTGVADLFAERDRLVAQIRARVPASRADTDRAIAATELAFVSDRVGSGVEWETTTGFSDAETIRRLRSIQRKVQRGATL
ncbi:hypothetical protein QUV83_00845 [Cellulomonas cellasea]|uniref:hypothetical protein n=1 Tax=Cellulomonas cellasea TaxID=43670 RepID=UPI0025A357F8|nr:hypothetical protein [Cellulomonas cellasea]MDM8083312.1 hypothetical protein [Cellulomonas cellasea]